MTIKMIQIQRVVHISGNLLQIRKCYNYQICSKLLCNPSRITTSFISCNVRSCSTKNIVKPFFDHVDIPSNMFFPQFLWEGAVKNHGSKPALIDGISGKEYTYNEAFTASKKFGTAVRQLGLNKGGVVAFFLHNCPEYITSLTGVIGVGGIATTVNPSYTATEVTRQLEMSNAQMILTISDLVLVAKQAVENTKRNIIIIVLDTGVRNTVFYHDILQSDKLFPEPDMANFAKEDIVILPYSSGTTGLPKGILVSKNNTFKSAKAVWIFNLYII